MEGQRYIPCPSNNEGCKYAPACHESEHHIYVRREADTKLKRAFGNLACNKVQVCRNIHDVLDTFPPPDYPEAPQMVQAWERAREREWKDERN